MIDIKHDPELPFALVYSDEEETVVTSRFIEREDAESWLEFNNFVNTRVVDTTPGPKIPEGAQHITWGEQKVAYSRWGGGWIGWDHGRPLSEKELLQWIGKDDVIVLVPKEEP